MTPFRETREGILAKTWSVKDVFLQVIHVGDFMFYAKHLFLLVGSSFAKFSLRVLMKLV